MIAVQHITERLPDIQSLSIDEHKKFMRRKFSETSRFQREFAADCTDLDCGEYAALIRAEIVRLLNILHINVPQGDLELLHEELPPRLRGYTSQGVPKLAHMLNKARDAQFMDIYHKFVGRCLQRYFPHPFYFQADVSIEAHCPTESEQQYLPLYTSNVLYGHPPETINIWMPLSVPAKRGAHSMKRTDVRDTRAILEHFDYDFLAFLRRSGVDKGFNQKISETAIPVTTEFGKICAFDSRCLRSSEPFSNHTRFSLSSSIIVASDFSTLPFMYRSTRDKTRFLPGSAYHPLSSEKLKSKVKHHVISKHTA